MSSREEMSAETDSRPVLPPAPAAVDPEKTNRALRELHRFHRRPVAALAADGQQRRAGALPGGAAADEELLPATLHALREIAPPEEPESEQEVLQLLAEAARRRLTPVRERFHSEARELVTRAQALIAADRRNRPESREPESVGGALGQLGSRFLDS